MRVNADCSAMSLQKMFSLPNIGIETRVGYLYIGGQHVVHMSLRHEAILAVGDVWTNRFWDQNGMPSSIDPLVLYIWLLPASSKKKPSVGLETFCVERRGWDIGHRSSLCVKRGRKVFYVRVLVAKGRLRCRERGLG